MEIAYYAQTDVGRWRKENEDAFLVDKNLGLFMVCDGMGGHAAGEVAAQRTLEVVQAEVRKRRAALRTLVHDPDPYDRASAVEMLERAILQACSEVFSLAESDPSKRGMGTTCVAFLLAGSKAILAHVGDSRAYLLRDGRLHRLTEDHTLVETQLKQGVITAEQAAVSPYRNVITRAVGIQEWVQVDTLLTDVLPGDRFILCSDGMHGYLDEEGDLPLLRDSQVYELPRLLVDLANERGGKDNITVVAVEALRPKDAQASAEAAARLQGIQRIPLFQHLDYTEQMGVVALSTTQVYRAGEVILREGALGDTLYVLLRGKVAIESGGSPLAELRAGSHFGEMGLIEHTPRTATVRAVEAATCMEIRRAELLALMRREPVLAMKLIWGLTQALSQRLRRPPPGGQRRR